MEPTTEMEKTMTSLFSSSGLASKAGDFMLVRAKLIVVGIIASLIMMTGMLITSIMSAKIKKVQRAGGCTNTDDLDKAYTWGWASALTFGVLMALFGGVSIALIASMFL